MTRDITKKNEKYIQDRKEQGSFQKFLAHDNAHNINTDGSESMYYDLSLTSVT